MSTVGLTVSDIKRSRRGVTHPSSIPSAFDYILLFSFCWFVCLFVSQLQENGRERFGAAETKAPGGSDSEEMFETQTRTEEASAGAHAEIKAQK